MKPTKKKARAKRAGRPPAAINARGEPEATTGWEQISCRIRPSTKATLEGLQSLDRRPLWQLFEEMLLEHIAGLSTEDRRVIGLIAQHRQGRKHL